MKNIFIIIFSLFFLSLYSQTGTHYIFNVELSDRNQAPTFTLNNGILVYSGNNDDERIFFSNYTITNFYQTYPSSNVSKSLNIFTFETLSANLMNDLVTQFRSKYLRVENLTGQEPLLLYYPNDYGNGIYNPNPNLGANLSLKSFDYINAPKAWDYTLGNVTIGISDGKVNNTDLDFGSKVAYLNESNFNSTFSCGDTSWHGTGVGAIAAAQGNNSHGMTGVCPDCNILNVPYQSTFNGLLELANSGVRVINMSWASSYNSNDPTYQTGYIQSQQDILDELYDMGVVLVAAAGNERSFSYAYPASYNHVISVSGVNYKNKNITDEITYETFGTVSWYNEDLASPTGTYENGIYSSYNAGFTTNSRVDICAPGWQAPLYSSYLLNCLDSSTDLPSYYGNGTSAAAPYVTGTVALMLSLNPCLTPDEVEDILQLTSKNIEANPYNSYYIGRIGSGKLETGDSVEFVSNMMNATGNAIIDGQDFWRFNFDLKHIFNGLTISNQIFRDQNNTNLTAKKYIDIIQNSDFKPDSQGFVDLNIDANIDICNSSPSKIFSGAKSIENTKVISSKIQLFPNPNKGNFTIMLSHKDVKELSVSVFDILGKQVYQTISNTNVFDISIPNLPAGVYLVKLSSTSFSETLKFIKE